MGVPIIGSSHQDARVSFGVSSEVLQLRRSLHFSGSPMPNVSGWPVRRSRPTHRVTRRPAWTQSSSSAAMLGAASWFAGHAQAVDCLHRVRRGEEQGLQGARQFVQHPPLDLKRIVAVVNMDMIGRGDANTWWWPAPITTQPSSRSWPGRLPPTHRYCGEDPGAVLSRGCEPGARGGQASGKLKGVQTRILHLPAGARSG
jgi:hypothetical protein